jgi:hypothetical protein
MTTAKAAAQAWTYLRWRGRLNGRGNLMVYLPHAKHDHWKVADSLRIAGFRRIVNNVVERPL